jgi:hypothetical protein
MPAPQLPIYYDLKGKISNDSFMVVLAKPEHSKRMLIPGTPAISTDCRSTLSIDFPTVVLNTLI